MALDWSDDWSLQNHDSYTSSAPGSFFLFGEHAVLYGGHAIVFAIDKRIKVSIHPRTDNIISIYSALGETHIDIAHLDKAAIKPPFQFVIAALVEYRLSLTQGCEIHIASEFGHELGLGSSAAVTVALIGALNQWLRKRKEVTESSREMLFHQAKRIILSVQGVGSGADVAASIWGGVLFYREKPLLIEPIPTTLPIFAIYSGSKMPTVEVITAVKQKQKQYPDIFEHFYQAIDACTIAAKKEILSNNWINVGELMSMQHGIFKAKGLTNPSIDHIILSLRHEKSVLGAKISGAGLGDCVIGLGDLPSNIFFQNEINTTRYPGISPVPVAISFSGLSET